MLTYNLTNIGSDSLYEYLYKCIKKDIILGNIKPGERLPSKRPFSKNLGVSYNAILFMGLTIAAMITASIVVPPGEQTSSLRTPGCFPVSKIFLLKNK